MGIKVLVAAGGVAAALAGAGAWSYAQGAGGGVHGPCGAFGSLAFHHAMGELGLSAEQKTQVKGILRSHRQELQEIGDRLRDIHQSVRQAANQDVIDEAAIREQVREATLPLGDLALLHARVHHEIFAVLTPEQRQKAEELHEKLRSHREQMRRLIHGLGDDLLEDHS
jgi:Spy/CpxP family protein refolding chaperone